MTERTGDVRLESSKDYDVVFLDIDGVLCTSRAVYGMSPRISHVQRTLDPVGVQFFNRLAQVYQHSARDLRFVMSSTWRRDRDNDARDLLLMAGLEVRWHADWRTPVKFSARPRGEEIEEWLETNEDNPPHLFVIVDDDSFDLTQFQKTRLVCPNSDDGLSFKNMRKIVSALNVKGF